MSVSSLASRQPVREAWSHERLVRERAIALGQAIDNTTWRNYSSALNSYFNFVKLHDMPVDPTPDTLSFFVVFMSHHIKPDSVATYLSGICQQLEPFFPRVREFRLNPLVTRTLAGCKRLRAVATNRKHALCMEDLIRVVNHFSLSSLHDDFLFVSQLLTGFFALLRLGELTYPDNNHLRDPRKVTKRLSVSISESQFLFFLPGHKGDRFFEGNTIIIRKNSLQCDPYPQFLRYLNSRDSLFPFSSPLWLRASGEIPTRAWFISRLRSFFDSRISGQSMRAGGATTLAQNGVAPHLIQAIGRWKSETFLIYVRKNPVLIQALIHGNGATT